MAKRGTVGAAIATAYVKDEKDIPDYEFPDSGHVKLNLTEAELAVLEELPSETDTASRTLPSTTMSTLSEKNKQLVRIRLTTSIAVLTTFGFICVLLSSLARVVQNAVGAQAIVGMMALVIALLTREWYRIHGEKLTRALKILFNVANILRSSDTPSADILGIEEVYQSGEGFGRTIGIKKEIESPKTNSMQT